jgi:hypothetical protein
MRKLKLVTLATVLLGAALPAAAAAKLSPPRLVGPANGATFQQLPAISWQSVRRAAHYEYEISADRSFHSILGSGTGKGTSQTYNLAASLDQVVPNGRYSWRVRGVTAAGAAGRWSKVRTMVKNWSATPTILAGNGANITWPSTPLVLHWSTVPYAVKYLVTIATDPALSNQVVGSPSQPQYTDGTSFVLPTTLANGSYYWAVTPVDAENKIGVRSRVGSFTWSWPTTTTLSCVSELLTTPSGCPGASAGQAPIVQDPFLSWAPIAGAAKYDVEINSSPDFPAGSKWCCSTPTIGTSLAPQQALANDSSYWWRVRALDANGNAGQWNYGGSSSLAAFRKVFDGTTPTIPKLTVRDANGAALTGSPPSTDTPIVTWNPVPGASRYEVQLGTYVTPTAGSPYCDWSAVARQPFYAETPTTAWTPLGQSGGHPGPSAWPYPQYEFGPLPAGVTYCERVNARSDDDAQGHQVVSDWSYVNASNDPNLPAFTYAPQPAVTTQPFFSTNPIGFICPDASAGCTNPVDAAVAGGALPHTPVLTWQWFPGARGYYVVIARDAAFTDVADIAFTNVPAYAPRLGNSEPLADKQSAYYWAVIPTQNPDGTAYGSIANSDSFNKSSVAPTPLQPADGANVSTWPTFQWTSAENARNYTLQVSQDPSFGNPIDNVTTDATAYTSSSTYPADTLLYWRVRGNDWTGQGLNWSPVRIFTRRLAAPTPAAGNPTSGELEPVLSWSLVPGAIAYNVHIEEGNGQSQDATVDSTAFAPTTHTGIGAVHWQVRALFPTSFSTVGGGFFAPQPYLLTLGPPAGVRGTKSGSRIVITWKPDPAAKQYEVDVSSTDSFSALMDEHRVDGTSWSPSIDPVLPGGHGRLYWRVAAISSDGITTGAYATGSFAAPKAHKAGHKRKRKRKHK